MTSSESSTHNMDATSVVREFEYKWKIQVKDLFSDQDVKSPAFSRPDDDTGNWWLEVIGCQDANGDLCVRLGIRLLADSSPVNGRVRFSIDGTEFQGSEVIHDFQPIEPGELASVMYALPLLVITKWANGKIEDQNLTVHCHLWLLLPSITFPMANNQTAADKLVRARLEREDLWACRNWGCDVIIRCRHSAVPGEKNLDRVTWANDVFSDSEVEGFNRDALVDRVLRENEKAGRTVVVYGGGSGTSAEEMSRPGKSGAKSWPSVRRQTSRAQSIGGGKHSHGHGHGPRGINAIRAGMFSGEGESIGFGHVRSNLDDVEYASSVDESEVNSEEETDTDSVSRGWIVDTQGTSEPYRDKNAGSERRFGDYYNRRTTSSSTVRSTATSGNTFFRDGNFAEFHVHRAVLRFRSPVFRQMLADPRMNVIEVIDTDAAAMEELLRFIYTGSVSNDALNIIAEQLLQASSKYEMIHLKGQCEDVLSASLSVDNALRLLLLADTNRAQSLKDNICVFAQKDYKDIFRTPYFRQFQSDHPRLSNEFMTVIFARPSNA